MKFEPAPDVHVRMQEILTRLSSEFKHVRPHNLVCMRSHGSKSNAIARIWSLPRIWQKALGTEAHYVIEVVSHRFDHLNPSEKDRVLIHELLHIPKTFSGALRPHSHAAGRIDRKTIERFYAALRSRE